MVNVGSRNEGNIYNFSLLFCWQPSIIPVRPPTSSVTMGTASLSGGHVMVTWIAKMVLMRIQSTVVNTNALASGVFTMSAVQEVATGNEILFFAYVPRVYPI